MKNIKECILLSAISLSQFCMASVSLFPEDGSDKIRNWYYSEKEIPFFYKENNSFQDVVDTFKKVGINPVNAKTGSFFQDLAFFDKDGRLILQHFPVDYTRGSEYEKYFKGFTMEIFMPPEWPGGEYEVNLLIESDAKNLGIEHYQLENVFIEGGATISGRFKNGDDYVIVNHSTYLGLKAYFKDKFNGITENEMMSKIEEELSLKPGNFIYLKGTSSIHLDTIMKALPNGVIMLDDPSKRVHILKELEKESLNPNIKDYLEYEQKNTNSFKDNARKKAYLQLKDRFKVIQIPGVFTRYEKLGFMSRPMTDVNFFNGVSGFYEGKHFFITNKSELVPELEVYWTRELTKLGIDEDYIFYPGVYRGNAGLDCFGSPAP